MYYVIAHGDPDICGIMYWTGYKTSMKDHTFSLDRELAVRFCRYVDAERAGLHLTKGIKILEINE